MKIKNIMVILVLISLFHFSPLLAKANEVGENEEQVTEEYHENDESINLQSLQVAASTEEAVEIQEKLVKLGFLSNEHVTGLLDEHTVKAVKELQKYYGLPESGNIDETTSLKMDEVLSSPFQVSKSHSDTVSYKKYLVILGYAKFTNPNEYFGSQTEQAVKDFQRDQGLPVSGIIESNTGVRLKDLATGPLQNGMYRDDAIEFKKNLEKLGFISWKSPPNNYFGSSTEQALTVLQNYYGLTETGIVDEATLAKVEEVLASPFQSGKNHSETVQLKEYLTILGYADFKNPTTYYGAQTSAAVKDFQKAEGLAVSGIIEPVTKARLTELATRPLAKGMRRLDAIQFKLDLEKLGFISWKNPPNDFYGDSTEKAVLELQNYYSLPKTGIADKETLTLIKEVLESPFQKGKSNSETIILKEYLMLLGYANFKNPTTYYGVETSAAVKDFQKSEGLVVSGIIEPVTKARLTELATRPLENGMRRSDAIEFKLNLEKLGFVSWKNPPNDFYGASTEQSVIELQKYYGLPITGKADQATLSKIKEVLNSPLQMGKSNDASISLKEQLVQLGYAEFKNPTKYYGIQTETAVKDFQRDYNLVVSGIAEEITIQKILEVLESSLKQGVTNPEVVELKKQLNRLGFPISDSTQNYNSETSKAVSNFQKHYGLISSGVANPKTVEKINEILSTPFQRGVTHEDNIQLKKFLEVLGYVKWQNEPNGFFGASTEQAVKDFQADNGLPVSGIIDEITLSLLAEAANAKEVVLTTQYDITLTKALSLQMNVNPQSDKYYSGYISSSYMKVYDGGTITGLTVNLRTSPEITNGNVYKGVGVGERFILLDDNVTGTKYSNSTRWYKIEYEGRVLYVHSSLAEPTGKMGVTTERVNIRAGQGTNTHVYETVNAGTVFSISQVGTNWHKVNLGYKWRNATSDDTLYYLDPRNFVKDENQKYQFLDLRHFTGVPVEELNKLLQGAGKLAGKGAVFSEAARKANINEIYLVSHAILETGRGSSSLADGSMKHEGKSVYNFFGIGAYDNCAKECGKQRAIQEGWFTVDEAIIGGAQFAKNDYIYAGQHTLYLMRWNPANMVQYNRAGHQYATDIGWASKQITNYKNIYSKGNYNLIFDVPVYK
ncbi:peptidoglycan-binding protein [Ornithinibacillus sp. BX22]|uniref:Peptidoglycan-binding protein n=1 Tax=Ornithinibacillus hominis TaxID=2763055 RepID=A0A923L3A3_9BACI|nr:peptidoglycan-binding protein [Ornithinibacillus hominis]